MTIELLKLEGKINVHEIATKLNEIIEVVNKSSDRRGPKSTREMTDDDAMRVIAGDMKDVSHKECAEKMNLSYAQVYSCRKEFTFKHIHKKVKDEAKAKVEVTS